MKRHSSVACGFLLFLFCYFYFVLIEMMFRSIPWMYDVADYWLRGCTLSNGGFKLNSIDGFRGYLYPFFLAIVNSIGGRLAWYIVNPAIMSVILLSLLKGLNVEYKNDKEFNIKVIVMVVMVGILFAGTIAFPLSDFMALACVCAALLFLNKWMTEKGGKIFLYSTLAGIFSYFAYNIRTIYLFSLIGLVVIYIALSLRNKRKLLSIIGFGIGCFVAGIPQIIMNYLNLGKLSIKVPTNGLMLQQMFWGIQYQRYDTYIVGTSDLIHPTPKCFFADPSGMLILNKLGLSSFSTWGDYIKLFIHYPFDVIAIYVRHLVNFIFPCWPQVYVQNLDSLKWPFGILGVSILFLGVYLIISRSYKNAKYLWLLIPVFVPSLLIIPGAVEYRFSLGIYFYILFNICFNTDWKEFKKSIKKDKVKVIVTYLVVLMFCIAVWSSMLAMEATTPLLF